MPLAYDIGALGITATTTSTLVASFLTSTAAYKPSCGITGVWANIGGNAMTTAGGGYMEAQNWQTVGVQTTTTAPNKKNFNSSAAQTLVVALAANGSIGTGTQTTRITVGFAQTGGPGFWMATTPDMALTVPPGGSTTGYVDFLSRTASATELMNWNIEFQEM